MSPLLYLCQKKIQLTFISHQLLMPIINYPFTVIVPGISRPMLWVRVSHPVHQNIASKHLAIIDTGADDCLFPSDVAKKLGHDLKSVQPKQICGIRSTSLAYPHPIKIEVLEMGPTGYATDNVLYTIPNTPIDFLEGGQNFLLGSRTFLSKFILTVDYPQQFFSLQNPAQH